MLVDHLSNICKMYSLLAQQERQIMVVEVEELVAADFMVVEVEDHDTHYNMTNHTIDTKFNRNLEGD